MSGERLEAARETVVSWLSRDYWDDTAADGIDLSPILGDIERVSAHLDAEQDRLAAESQAVFESEQSRVEALPRGLFELHRTPRQPSSSWGLMISHRTPIDCWSARCYRHPDCLGHVYLDGVLHGDFVRVDARGADRGESPDDSGCQCISDAVVSCTDEYAAKHHGAESARYECTPLPPTGDPS